jgi:hypothetical protein
MTMSGRRHASSAHFAGGKIPNANRAMETLVQAQPSKGGPTIARQLFSEQKAGHARFPLLFFLPAGKLRA